MSTTIRYVEGGEAYNLKKGCFGSLPEGMEALVHECRLKDFPAKGWGKRRLNLLLRPENKQAFKALEKFACYFFDWGDSWTSSWYEVNYFIQHEALLWLKKNGYTVKGGEQRWLKK